MTSSSGFKEKKSWHCLPRARMNMKNTKETVYHCDNSCEMFVQFDVSFWDLYLLYALPVFFIIFGRITKLIVKKSGVVPVKSGVVSLQSLAGQNSEATFPGPYTVCRSVPVLWSSGGRLKSTCKPCRGLKLFASLFALQVIVPVYTHTVHYVVRAPHIMQLYIISTI